METLSTWRIPELRCREQMRDNPGEWDDEPDRMQWPDETTDLPCLAVRNPMGALCGYVGLSAGHPWYGKSYDAWVKVPQEVLNRKFGSEESPFQLFAVRPELYDQSVIRIMSAMRVHGGLTFSEGCTEHICHVPAPGEPDDTWWFGFDCAHSGDMCPSSRSEYRASFGYTGIYRNLAYVQEECAKLAKLLVDVKDWPDTEVPNDIDVNEYE